jgi:hypothetical protein
MIQAFLDESGIHDGAEVCVIAGYCGHQSTWKRFSKRWCTILRAADVPIDKFHAVDLIEHHKFFFQMPRDKHEELIMDLAHTVASVNIYSVTVGLILGTFLNLSEPQKRFFTGTTIDDSISPGKLCTSGCPTTPYFMPFLHCVRKVFDNVPKLAIDFHFGFAQSFYGYAAQMFEMIRQRDPAVRTPLQSDAKSTPEMQAADFLSYTSYKHMQERHASGDWNVMPSEPLRTLLTNRQHAEDCQFFNHEAIADSLQMTYERVGSWDGHI